jgi:hypothetical protein
VSIGCPRSGKTFDARSRSLVEVLKGLCCLLC